MGLDRKGPCPSTCMGSRASMLQTNAPDGDICLRSKALPLSTAPSPSADQPHPIICWPWEAADKAGEGWVQQAQAEGLLND